MNVYTFSFGELTKFLILLMRIGGITVFLPFFSSANIPVPVRVGFVLGLSLLLYPALSPALAAPALNPWSLTYLAGGELLIGMLIGLVSRFLFAGFELAGQYLGFQVGFSMINAIDPQTQVQSTVLSVSQSLIGLMLFIGLDAHHWLIGAVCDSFLYLAPLKTQWPSALSGALLKMSAEMFVIGFKLSAPVMVVLVLTDIIFGMIGRAAPQVQILVIGLPLKSWISFFLLSVSFYFVPAFIAQHLSVVHGQIATLLRQLAVR